MYTYIKYLFTDAVICHWHLPSFLRRRRARRARDREIKRLQREEEKAIKLAEANGQDFFVRVIKLFYFNQKTITQMIQLPGYRIDKTGEDVNNINKDEGRTLQ